jgi:hypothetical protein
MQLERERGWFTGMNPANLHMNNSAHATSERGWFTDKNPANLHINNSAHAT